MVPVSITKVAPVLLKYFHGLKISQNSNFSQKYLPSEQLF
jgi:hypothetical protein